ncbi:MAG: hypothetical protein AABY27_05205 [Pseudomonadota bacterium]
MTNLRGNLPQYMHRKLDTESSNLLTINVPGSYNITTGFDVDLATPGDITLQYDSLTDVSEQNIIILSDTNAIQTTTVYGFNNQTVSLSPTTIVNGTLGGPAGLVLVMSVAALGITGMGGLALVALLVAPGAGTVPSVEIIANQGANDQQSIILVNVTASALTEDNFIFAENSSGGDDGFDYAGLYLGLEFTAAVVGGSLATIGIGYVIA